MIIAWKPPSPGWLKGNADGAFDAVSHSGGIGVVIQNHFGDIVGGVCMKLEHVSSPEMVEALVARAACELAVRFSLTPIVFEVDSLLVVQASKSAESNTTDIGRIYEDISASLIELPGASFSHVMRTSNVEAHRLAKLALRTNIQTSWFGVVPSGEIRSFIQTQ